MKRVAPLHPIPAVPRRLAAPLLALVLAGCTPLASAQPNKAPTAPPPAPVASNQAATPTSAARDTTPPLVNGVEMVGITNSTALERTVSGHLVTLNGRYKLRGTMTVFEPGGHIGGHHHAGPGLRYVLAGELTYSEAGRTHVFRRGDWFFESGDTTSSAANKSADRDTILNFEILPADWFGPSTMQAPSSR